MMDLSAKVAALEEELGILRGEIKAILQEVRTAVLARDNPFSFDLPEPARPVAFSVAASAEPAPPPPATAALAPVFAGSQASVAEEGFGAALPAPARPNLLASRHRAPAATPAEHDEAAEGAPEARRNLDTRTLAGLMAWTQEAAQRFRKDDLAIVLALARYGGLVSLELEQTLTSIGGSLDLPPDQKPATILDFLLALRQLEAVLGLPVGTSTPQQEVA